MKPIYSATASAVGGREGHVRSADGIIDLDLRMPKELGGSGGAATNPEQLFAAGYSACFESALRLVARNQKANLGEGGVTAIVTIGKDDSGGFGLGVELRSRFSGVPSAELQKLMEMAHQVCPYSKATRGNIQVTLVAEG